MLNRSALILRYKQPFVDWINGVDPPPSRTLTLPDLEQERTVYLVEVEDQQELEDWLERNYRILFEEELFGWYTDASLWPSERSLKLLREWCSFDFHSVVIDTGSSPLKRTLHRGPPGVTQNSCC